ncbi:MAG: hypothetical protein ACI4LB_04060, partial [Candidatus Fimenecus sp.]
KYPDLEVYTAGNSLYIRDAGTSDGASSYYPYIDAFVRRRRGGAVLDLDFMLSSKGTSMNSLTLNADLSGYNSTIVAGEGTVKRKAAQMTGYGAYHQLDTNVTNHITLTSVDAVKMKNSYTAPAGASQYYPTSSYTLYCGYIPAVMDLWTTKPGNNTDHAIAPGKWRATLGLAFEYNGSAGDIMHVYDDLINGSVKDGGILGNSLVQIKFDGIVWTYDITSISEKNFSLSGLCGPSNYSGSGCTDIVQAVLDENARGRSSVPMAPMYALSSGKYQENLQNMNETVISLSYLSNPYAFADKNVYYNNYAQSPNRSDERTDGVYEWCFSESTTIMDTASVLYENDAGEEMYLSLAVGYYVGGLANDSNRRWDNTEKGSVVTPAVMNNGIVYMRAGGEYGGTWKGYALQSESNVFNEFFTTNDYFNKRNDDVWGPLGTPYNKNTMEQAVSAGYWRDKYHPLFYSLFGGEYTNGLATTMSPFGESGRDPYSYLMSHILMGKKLKTVSWGWLYNGYPQAMWGADDGTLMSWQGDPDPLGTGNTPKLSDQSTLSKLDDTSICAEFQSYQWYKQAIDFDKQYMSGSKHPQLSSIYTNPSATQNDYYLPRNWDGIQDTLNGKKAHNTTSVDSLKGKGDAQHPVGAFTNAYYDKCSIQLGKTDTLGFISPLDTVEDVTYANDTWVAGGVQGLANPRWYDGVEMCKEKAVVKKAGYSDEGSWICVRSWYDQSGGTDKGPVSGNCNYVWQAVQISQIKNCNIQQVTYCNGMWYAVGYIDTNDNGEYDYTVESGQQREHAVVFYAVDPTQPCGTEKGWKLSDPGNVGYTQAYANDGSGNYTLLNIDGVNSVASRND